MQLNTAIFDMDGLMIDSEPLWNEAAAEVFKMYGVSLSEEQYHSTTGLRTKEFVQWWFQKFNLGDAEHARAERLIFEKVIYKIQTKGNTMPGVQYIFRFFHERNFRIGIASSSPLEMIDIAIHMCGIQQYVHAKTSAENLPYGKPHPQVYLDCAASLDTDPLACLCFEDSFPGLIAVKAARMKCVVVPHFSQQKSDRWTIADLKISSLQNFGELHLNLLQ
jgi:mannitol-1-/sugar-/sorbitol-6-/2-deoxyglucose-6-phosphatase